MRKKTPGATNRGLNNKIDILVTDEMRSRLNALAQLRNVSMGHVVREALEAHLRQGVAA